MRPQPDQVLVSAHRCGAGDVAAQENSAVALERSLGLGVDYVEFDVQRCRDGALVVIHDAAVDVDGRSVAVGELTLAELRRSGHDLLAYDDVLDAIAGRSKAHIDLKFDSPSAAYDAGGTPYETEAAARAVARLGAGNVIVTTQDDHAVRAVRDWSREHAAELLVGLSLGRSVRGLPWHRQLAVRLSELLPRMRFLHSGANLVVANHALARLGVAAFARRRGLPLLVWTVDREASLRYWLRPGRAWLVTTNHPGLALDLRRRAATRG